MTFSGNAGCGGSSSSRSWRACRAAAGRPVLTGRAAACPPVVEYSAELQARAAAEVEVLPEGSAVAELLSDYAVMRDQARAVRGDMSRVPQLTPVAPATVEAILDGPQVEWERRRAPLAIWVDERSGEEGGTPAPALELFREHPQIDALCVPVEGDGP